MGLPFAIFLIISTLCTLEIQCAPQALLQGGPEVIPSPPPPSGITTTTINPDSEPLGTSPGESGENMMNSSTTIIPVLIVQEEQDVVFLFPMNNTTNSTSNSTTAGESGESSENPTLFKTNDSGSNSTSNNSTLSRKKRSIPIIEDQDEQATRTSTPTSTTTSEQPQSESESEGNQNSTSTNSTFTGSQNTNTTNVILIPLFRPQPMMPPVFLDILFFPMSNRSIPISNNGTGPGVVSRGGGGIPNSDEDSGESTTTQIPSNLSNRTDELEDALLKPRTKRTLTRPENNATFTNSSGESPEVESIEEDILIVTNNSNKNSTNSTHEKNPVVSFFLDVFEFGDKVTHALLGESKKNSNTITSNSEVEAKADSILDKFNATTSTDNPIIPTSTQGESENQHFNLSRVI